MEEKIKIGLMGSASLGKTTTATMLSEYLGIELHKELESRLITKLIRQGKIANKSSFTPEQSKAYQNRALAIREYLSKRDSFISDRVAGELWVYHQMYCAKHSTQEELDLFRERCLNVMKKYDYLFLFPFGQIPLVDDNYRNTNKEYQRQVHQRIEEMLVEFDVPYVSLIEKPLSKEERFKEVLSWIKK